MQTFDGLLKIIQTGGPTSVAIFAAWILWKMDRRMSEWDKKICVETQKYQDKFEATDLKTKEHGDELKDHECRIGKVEDKILIYSQCEYRNRN